MNIQRFFGKCLSAYYIITSKAQPDFSQAGEDRLVSYLFNSLRIPKPTYLDIGTNHPIIGNNTYYFYDYNPTPPPHYSEGLAFSDAQALIAALRGVLERTQAVAV